MYSDLILRLKKKAEEMEDDSFKCALCGEEMIRRKSKWGPGYWWGCSNYPRCRHTVKE